MCGTPLERVEVLQDGRFGDLGELEAVSGAKDGEPGGETWFEIDRRPPAHAPAPPLDDPRPERLDVWLAERLDV
jgi:hypothetical protein